MSDIIFNKNIYENKKLYTSIIFKKLMVSNVLTVSDEIDRKQNNKKHIVITTQNYEKLCKMGYAGQSMNDVVTKLLDQNLGSCKSK